MKSVVLFSFQNNNEKLEMKDKKRNSLTIEVGVDDRFENHYFFTNLDFNEYGTAVCLVRLHCQFRA